MLNPLSGPAELDRDTAEKLSSLWWTLLLAGIVSVIAGILILTIDWNVEDLALFVSFLFIVKGVFTLATPPVESSDRSWDVFKGVVEIVVGIAFLAWPEPTLLTLAIFIGAWIVVSGLFTIVGAIANRHDVPMWWLFLIFGIVEVPLGIILLNRPSLTLAIAIAMVGIWAILVGTLEIVSSFEVKDLPRKLGMSSTPAKATPSAKTGSAKTGTTKTGSTKR
jgi:uncharacterized membrane protein HdeD (DUF308 family)